MPLIEDLLRKEEGLRLDPYRDNLGFWTIGYGHLIDRRRNGMLPPWVKPSFPITKEEAEQLLMRDIAEKVKDLEDSLPWYTNLDEVRQAILISMSFQLGIVGLMKFHETLAAIKEQRWQDAANGMRASLWASQTSSRVERLAQAMVSGDKAALEL